LQDAKEATGLSRKYLVPFLEKLDELKLTKRDEQERIWMTSHLEEWMSE
jgi:selenocysteine-specific elongation factor